MNKKSDVKSKQDDNLALTRYIIGFVVVAVPAILIILFLGSINGFDKYYAYLIFFITGFIISTGFSLIIIAPNNVNKNEKSSIAHPKTNTNICIVCNGNISPTDKICPRCHTELDKTGECSVCGEEIARNVTKCPNCNAIFT
ncbi:MAG: hypothetical protein M1481_04835 [Candidatus Thermoplasmatota archaeon]|jgi:hypothetical protein|nr:hypothetical protein [Candidatus Thermoplasmatota archaeon]MCL5963257.1 hypothetical protein [Candidatus Thermoplasmatota archaeon]